MKKENWKLKLRAQRVTLRAMVNFFPELETSGNIISAGFYNYGSLSDLCF
jgi:hypothetical protein